MFRQPFLSPIDSAGVIAFQACEQLVTRVLPGDSPGSVAHMVLLTSFEQMRLRKPILLDQTSSGGLSVIPLLATRPL